MTRFRTTLFLVIGLSVLFFGCARGTKDKPFWELGDYLTERTAMDTPNLVRHVFPAHQAEEMHPETSIHVLFDHIMDRFSVSEAFHMSPEATGTVSWDNQSFTFTPTDRLAEKTKYYVTLDTQARDIYNMPMEGPISWWFMTGNIATGLASSNPARLDTGVPVDSNITLTFNHSMHYYSVQKLLSVFPRFTGRLEWTTPETMVINPDTDLKYYTEYEITVKSGALAQESGPLEKDIVVTFWTARAPVTVPPRISSTSPLPDYEYSTPDTIITIVMEKKIDPATVTAETVKLLNGANEISSVPFLQTDGLTITVTPGTNLKYNNWYTVKLSGAIKDRDGRGFDGDRDGTGEGSPADDYTFTFKTVKDREAPRPKQARALNSHTIKLTFTEPMSAGTDNLGRVAYGFTEEYHRVVKCDFNTGDDFVILTVDTPLNHGFTYGLTMSGLLKDLAGNILLPGDTVHFTGIGIGHDIEYEAHDFILDKILLPSESVRLSSLRDKPVLLHFFSVFSPQSSTALAVVEGMYPEFVNDFHFICVSLEGIGQNQLPSGLTGGTTLLNSGRQVADILHMTPVPGTMLLDRYGVINWWMMNGFDESKLRQQLEEFQGGPER